MSGFTRNRDRELSKSASRTADKYITKRGDEPGQRREPRTYAEKAWCEHAETVHRFLRQHVATPEGAAAIAALERIGDGIALTEKGLS